MMKKDVDVFVLENKEQASRFAAELIASEINSRKKRFNLGLATGETMIPLYRALVKMYRGGKVSFAHVRTFTLDEYIGVTKESSFRYFLKQRFLSKVNVAKKNQHFLCKENFNEYEKEIAKVGGIDLWILGIGRNGHIAFNEPGSGFGSRTRKVTLREETRRANKKFFSSLKETPKEAVSVGVGTILEARKVLLLAFGSAKAQAIGESLNHRARAQWPASSLQNHKISIFIVDRLASSQLRDLDARRG